MIELRDKDKNRVAGLVDYENLCIESVLDSGDKTLSFYYPKKGKYYDEIVEEAYIRTKKDEFVVKAREIDDDYSKFECSLNLEELEGNIFDRFESIEQTITLALNLAIAGTGWTVKDNTLKKRRTVRCTNKSSLEIVREIKKVYRVDIVFNTLRKQIEVYEHLGEDKGTYFIDSLNLIALQIQSDSRQYATRIIAEGKDGLSFSDINNGKNYVENYQYSNKIKTIYWKDERYSVKENLLDDARAKLEELSKPFRSYSARILNLAELNPKYKNILDYSLGDTITLLSKSNKLRDKQRIVKTLEYLQDHSRDTVELANAILKFEDIQQENQETTDTVNNITTDNGTVDGSTIDSITTKQIEDFEANVIKVAKLKAILAEIENLHVNKADIQNLNAVIARIGTLEATKASITELNAIHAIIQQIKAGKADIADLNAAVAKVGILENKTAVLENALAGNLTAENFKANSITATSGIIAEGAIGSAQISSLSLNKLEAGDITTSKHRIISADGTIEIVGNQILINRNNVNRVILGEYRKSDGTTEYGLLVRAKDGQTIMLDGNGVHNAGITDGAIDNNKVADNANISGNKLDINSVIREVNNNGTETIKGTKVTVGDRTLDVELSTQKNTITEHSKELSSQKASLTALDNALKFKVDSQTFTQSTQTINNNINRAKEEAIKAAENLALEKSNLAKKYADEVATAKANLAKTEAIANADGKISAEEQKRIQQAQENLNTAISKADKAKQDAILEANRVAELKKQEAISSANSHADSKANEALNNAKAFVNAEITTVNSHLNKTTAEINVLKEKIESKVSQVDIDKSIQNIKLGTRNLLLNSNKTVGESATSEFIQFADIAPIIDKYGLVKYTISFDIKSKDISKCDVVNCYCQNGSATKYSIGYNPIKVTRSFKRVHITITPTLDNNNETKSMLAFYGTYNTGNVPVVRNVKIELGELASDYTEAPEDTDKLIIDNIKTVTDKISTVESIFTQENNNIKASVQNLNSTTQTITTNVSNINRNLTSRINSNLDIAKNFATSKATEALNNAKAFVNAEITTVNTKVHNLESNITILTDRINSKVSQSDIDRSITTVDNKIKIVDSKISDVSSSVTQLRDSVTTDIRAINSKTHSIETTLGSKASKQEVTEVNNRVATIKASLDGITQRVSATESKTQTLESDLNGKASKQEVNNVSSKVVSLEANLNGITNRVSSTETVTKSLNDKLWETTNKLNNVEQRITPISIINTVSSAYYKKGEVDNVFSTKSEVEQLDNRINYKFSNTGYSNLIFNGNFANSTVHWRNWGNCSLVAENGQLTVRAKQSSNNANIGAVSSTFVLEKGKKYSLTFQCCSSWNIPWLNYIYLLGEDGVNHRLDLRIDINSADLVYRTATFTAPATKWVRLLIGVEGYLQTDVSGFKLVDVCLVEGDIPRRFVPNANEISEGATSIDSNGVIVRHTNGSYTSMTLGGFEWKTKGMSKAYHCLAETGWVNISTGAWLGDHYDIKITLPEYFRGKVFTPCSMIQGWYVESNFSLNQLVVNIPYETINYSEGSFVIRVKALTRDGVFQRNINISWLAIA
ncbi:phage tail spike protein [Clostridium perfringens]|uniref:Phage tail spike protein n=1 Tax=Clostridium perfringens TaxID=1502 RepID=A0AAP4A8E2_CLOPF|nr:phage tail spike protein [Clostridium perfringens]MDH2337075.1 phage tail spike protein [Clostridium perfringens]